MLRIGICDDVYDARLVLRSALERVLDKRRVQGQFWEFSSGEGLLGWLEGHAGELDIVFLDMEMGELDGMETARRLRAADSGLQLVFVTGYADHVFDGYSVGALGYLLKPPKAEQLEAVLDRAQAALVRDLDRAYICRSGDTHYRIPIANILYFVSDRRQVTCVTEGRDYTFYGKLDAVAEEVGAGFVRVHQRYLVRAGAVDRMEGGEVVLRDGQHLPVSRSCQQSALLALTRMKWVLPFELFNAIIEVLSGTLRGLGYSFVPTILCAAFICGLRILWIAFVFPLMPTFQGLLLVYPVSWLAAGAALAVAYVVLKRKLLTEGKQALPI